MVKMFTLIFTISCGMTLSFTQIEGRSIKQIVNETTTDWNKFRYDVHTGKLTELELTKPCRSRMRFFAKPENETLGECDCDYFDCSRPLIYSPKTKSCHYAWTEGPCHNDEWYAFDKNLKPVCEKNTCPRNKSPKKDTGAYYFKRHEDGKCYLVGGQKPEFCNGTDEFLGSQIGEPIPICRSALTCGGVSMPAVQLCIPGYKYMLDGKC